MYYQLSLEAVVHQLGYRLAGGKILAVNEFVPEAQNTYRENYPDTLIIPGDIKN